MNSQQIFGLQVLLSFLVYGLVAKWYVTPRLAPLPLETALQPLLVLHALRHMGMVFLVSTVVGPRSRPASRSRPPTEISWRACSPSPRSWRSVRAPASPCP